LSEKKTYFYFVKQRIYIDTSAVGGYFDDELKEATITLFKRLGREGCNSTNLRLGFPMIEIRSPKDIVNYENE